MCRANCPSIQPRARCPRASRSRPANRHIVEEAGYTLADVAKATVLLADIADFAAMNGVYAEFFTERMPARVCYEVAALPMGAKVEIDAIAVR